jgi:hypothetical protein
VCVGVSTDTQQNFNRRSAIMEVRKVTWIQEGQFMYNVTLGRVRVTIVAVEKE